MTKYIVKNCPSCMKDTACFSTGTFNKSFQLNGFYKCENIGDCPIKQVIELVKGGNPFLTEKVLNILQVEEVE